MSDKSAAALEREAEAVRSQVADTAESLRDKMSPGQMIDEFRDYFSNSDGALAFSNLKNQVRDNPLPLALIGAGLAWFFLGGGPSVDRLRRSRTHGYVGLHEDDFDDDFSASSYTDDDWDESGMDALGGVSADADRAYGYSSGGSGKGSLKGKAGSMAHGVTDAVGGVASALSGAAGSARSAVEGAASAVSDTASSAAGAASKVGRRAARAGRMVAKGSGRITRRMQDGYVQILSREPLVLGAVGLAVGTAIGAMLPSTEYENEKLGPYRDRLREQAKNRVQEGIEEAKDIAESTYEAAKEEVDRQGLASGEQSLAGRAAKVASTAAATAEKQVRDKIESGTSKS